MFCRRQSKICSSYGIPLSLSGKYLRIYTETCCINELPLVLYILYESLVQNLFSEKKIDCTLRFLCVLLRVQLLGHTLEEVLSRTNEVPEGRGWIFQQKPDVILTGAAEEDRLGKGDPVLIDGHAFAYYFQVNLPCVANDLRKCSFIACTL